VEQIFTDAVEDALMHIIMTPEDKELCLRIVGEVAAARLATAGEEKNRLIAEIAAFERQKKRLLDLLLDGAISQNDHNYKRAELSEQLAAAQMKLGVFSEDLQQRIELARNFFAALPEDISHFQSAKSDGKKAIVRSLGLELVAEDKKVRVQAEEPTSILMDRSALPVWGQLVKEVMTYFLGTSTPHFFGGFSPYDGDDLTGGLADAA
jgi:hypothetical protein